MSKLTNVRSNKFFLVTNTDSYYKGQLRRLELLENLVDLLATALANHF